MTRFRSMLGSEYVVVLMRAGFRRMAGASGFSVLQCGFRTVLVPEGCVLDSDTLELLIGAAGIDPARFLELTSVKR